MLAMPRRALLLACALFTATLGTGCGGYEYEGVRMTGWVSSPFEDQLVRALVDSFQVRNPDLQVTYNPLQANYIEKMQLMLGTQTAPDVFMLEAFWAPALAEFEVLLPLDSLIAADPDFNLNDFEPSLLDAFRFNGQLYGLPKDYSTLVLYYNPEMLAAAGLDGPPTTWDELADYAERLTVDRDGDGTIDQFGFGLSESLDYLLPFVWQNGGDFFKPDGSPAFDEPEFVEALTYLQAMKRNGTAVLPTDLGAAWHMDAYGRSRVAMTTSGLWAYNTLRETYPDVAFDVAPLPVGKTQASISFVVGYTIPRAVRDPEAAWRLLRFLTSEEGQTAWANAEVGLPPRRSVVEALDLRADTLKNVFIESAAYARPWQLSADRRIADEMQTAIQAIFITDAPVEPTLQRLRERLTR